MKDHHEFLRKLNNTYFDGKVFFVPGSIWIAGNLFLSHTKDRFDFLPDGLMVDGNLEIAYTGISVLPRRLKVGGNVDIRGTSIADIPEDAEIGGEVVRDEERRGI